MLIYNVNDMFNFGPKVPSVSVQQLKSIIDEKKDIILLDVRTPGEYAGGKIANSINLSVEKVDSEVESIIGDKNKTIYVYCLSGSRSAQAVNIMIRKGYSKVYNVDNGILAWRGSGYAVL